MIWVVSYAYEVFNVEHSPWDFVREPFPEYRFSSSAYNYVAGSYGGTVGGQHLGIYGKVRFFSSGSMVMADEKGDSIGTFSSNFLEFSLGRSFNRGDLGIKPALSLRYVSLSPGSRGLALSLTLFAQAEISLLRTKGALFALLDGLGYEVMPVGVGRTVQPFRGYVGLRTGVKPFVLQVGGEYRRVGGISGMFALSFQRNVWGIKLGYDTRYSGLYGGYGRDRLAGSFLGLSLRVKGFGFEYIYNPLGLFGDRHMLALYVKR